MRILVAEDDVKIAQFIVGGLTESGYVVDHAGDGLATLQFLENGRFDLLILDLMLPKISGLEVLGATRKSGKNIPILILSAMRSVDERVLGLQSGGDDYLTKPFSFSELLARVQALLRRASGKEQSEVQRLSVGDLTIDRLSREVTRSGSKIDLQPKEFILLEFFMRNPGRVLSKTQILDRVWNFQFDPETNVVDVLVHRLRSKIDKDFSKKFIQTIRGAGYVFQSN